MNLMRAHTLRFGNEDLVLSSIETEGLPEYQEKIYVRTLSPITVYSTLESADGKKKTYYYSPFEKEFEDLLIKNLQRKLRAWAGSTVFSGSIKPYKVSSRDQRIVIYKKTVIKGWDGVFELNLPQEFFNIAFEAGLGVKNSLGFGCVEVWKLYSK
jgi:CRISPR-associated endoribonuclease Cas6